MLSKATEQQANTLAIKKTRAKSFSRISRMEKKYNLLKNVLSDFQMQPVNCVQV